MSAMTLEDLAAELKAQKETIQHLLVQLEEERQERQRRDAESAPVGTIAAFGGGTYANMPRGWLPCDGSSKSRTVFPQLFAAIGISWGKGDSHPNTFNLPDLRGMFLRGVDASAGRDPDKDARTAIKEGGNTGNKVGSIQPDQMQSHKHNDSGHQHKFPEKMWSQPRNEDGGDNYPGFSTVNHPNHRRYDETNPENANLTDPVDSGTGAGAIRHGKETRPKNAYIIWAIKADPQ